MLSPDDVVMVRTCARCWNDGVFYGDLGNYFFLLLTMKQYGKTEWGGAQRRLRHQFVDSIRKCGLPPQSEPLDVVVVKEILIEFVGKRDNPAWHFEGRSTVPVQEDIEDINSASSDSVSPDLEEVWQHGYPQSPMWDSERDCSKNVHDNAFEDGSVTRILV